MGGGSDGRACASCRTPLAAGAERCPECGVAAAPAGASGAAEPYPNFLSQPAMRYPSAYTWLVLVASLDVILTKLVLVAWGGEELNPLAAAVIQQMGFGGAVLFKFGLVVVAILLCEVVGRLSEKSGRRLAALLVVVGALPVVYTFYLLLTNPAPLPELRELPES